MYVFLGRLWGEWQREVKCMGVRQLRDGEDQVKGEESKHGLSKKILLDLGLFSKIAGLIGYGM